MGKGTASNADLRIILVWPELWLRQNEPCPSADRTSFLPLEFGSYECQGSKTQCQFSRTPPSYYFWNRSTQSFCLPFDSSPRCSLARSEERRDSVLLDCTWGDTETHEILRPSRKRCDTHTHFCVSQAWWSWTALWTRMRTWQNPLLGWRRFQSASLSLLNETVSTFVTRSCLKEQATCWSHFGCRKSCVYYLGNTT